MWFSDLEKAMQELKNTLDPYMITIRSILPAYNGIVFNLSDGAQYKYWYGSKTITKLSPWRK